MTLPSVIDTAGVALITGGASGFGFNMAERLVKNGMRVAILDVSQEELTNAAEKLRALAIDKQKVLPVLCNVSQLDQCRVAERKVAEAFPGLPISLLFNNAGIAGQESGGIIEGSMKDWSSTFAVHVFGAVHIIKAFLPVMISAGRLASGKKSYVVTTSSVVGLLNHNIGPYSVSKMAATAICEQLAIELEKMGEKAAHISPHSLHPTIGATKFLTGRNEKGEPLRTPETLTSLEKAGMTTAAHIIDTLFKGLDAGNHYIVHDHQFDVPTPKQIEMRMQDQMSGHRPRKPEQLGMLLLMAGDMKAFEERKQSQL